MSVKAVHKKWEIVKICWNIIEENNEVVRRLSPKVNVLEQFCRKNGLQELKENWRKNVETEIELKEKELEELTNKKKLEMFKECRIKLNSLIVDWKETPGKDEEIKYGMLKENIERERMDQVLCRHGVNVDDQNVKRRQPLEDDMKTVVKEVDSLCSSLCLKKKTESHKM